MKRPETSGYLGIFLSFALVLAMSWRPAEVQTLVLYCNRHRTNFVSVKPRVPLGSAGTVSELPEKVCLLEGRYPRVVGGPLPLLVFMDNCKEEKGDWFVPRPGQEITGWNKEGKVVDWQLGYYCEQYRLRLR